MCGKGKKTGVLVYGGGFRVIVYCFQIVSRVGGGWFSDPCCDSVVLAQAVYLRYAFTGISWKLFTVSNSVNLSCFVGGGNHTKKRWSLNPKKSYSRPKFRSIPRWSRSLLNHPNGNAIWTDLFVLAASRPVCVCTVPGSAVLSGTFNCAKIQSWNEKPRPNPLFQNVDQRF